MQRQKKNNKKLFFLSCRILPSHSTVSIFTFRLGSSNLRSRSSRVVCHSAVCCPHTDRSVVEKKKKRGLLRLFPSWSSAAASRQSAGTAHWRTSQRWTGRSPPPSPACSSAGRCGRCCHSAWNRSTTGLWPCCRLIRREKQRGTCNQVRGRSSTQCATVISTVLTSE